MENRAFAACACACRVKDVLGLLAAGATHQEILEDHSDLEDADILAALSYAAEQSDHLILRAA